MEVHCSRCGRTAPGLPAPPWPGAQGDEIHARVCLACWREWQEMQTKVINEFHLNLADAEDAARLDAHMMVFLGLREGAPLGPGRYGFGEGPPAERDRSGGPSDEDPSERDPEAP